MPRINVRHLQVFKVIMEIGTVSGAARVLNVSQPALTKTLKTLEGRMGVTLFERIKGRLHPTPDSHTLLPEVERLFGVLNSVEHLADEIKNGQVGRLTLAASPTLSSTVLCEAVAKFSMEQPRVAVQIKSLSTRAVIEELSNNQADVGLVDVPIGNDLFETIPLCEAEVACVVRDDDPLAERPSLGPKELVDRKLICFADDTYSGMMLRKSFRDAKQPFPQSIAINQSMVGCSLVRQGAGISIIDPFPLLTNPIPGIRLIPFRPEILIRPSMILPPERPQSILSEMFLETLKSSVDEAVLRYPLLRPT